MNEETYDRVVKALDSIEMVSYRAGMVCQGCGKAKEEGSLVCWDCFKRHPVDSVKWSELDIDEWMAKYGLKTA